MSDDRPEPMSEGPAVDVPPSQPSLEARIRDAINCVSAENESDTPDFILAQFLIGCLNLFDMSVNKREQWYGRSKNKPRPTISELEEILRQPDRKVTIRPDGSIDVT